MKDNNVILIMNTLMNVSIKLSNRFKLLKKLGAINNISADEVNINCDEEKQSIFIETFDRHRPEYWSGKPRTHNITTFYLGNISHVNFRNRSYSSTIPLRDFLKGRIKHLSTIQIEKYLFETTI